jgi:hypothetical protein
VADYIDRTLFDKAIDITAMALRGGMGGEGSQPAAYAAEVFHAIWGALKDASKDLGERPKAGF